MPIYSFCCDKCSNKFDLQRQILEYEEMIKNLSCPKCKSLKVYRDYQEDNIYSTVKEIRTVGQLAEYNTKKMGGKLKEQEAKKEEEENKKKPWYHDKKYGGATQKEISKMSEKKKKDYILKGKTWDF